MFKRTNAQQQATKHKDQAGRSRGKKKIFVSWCLGNKSLDRFYMTCIVYLPISYHTHIYLMQQGSTVFIIVLFLAAFRSVSRFRHWCRMCTGFIFYNKAEKGRKTTINTDTLYPPSFLTAHTCILAKMGNIHIGVFWLIHEQACIGNWIYNRTYFVVENTKSNIHFVSRYRDKKMHCNWVLNLKYKSVMMRWTPLSLLIHSNTSGIPLLYWDSLFVYWHCKWIVVSHGPSCNAWP